MKFSDLEKDIPVELTGILGEETVEIGDEPLSLQPLIEEMTGVSLSPYSQQKLMLSHENVGTSDRGPMFDQIFGDDAPAQVDFLRGMDSSRNLATVQIPQHRKVGFIERVMDQAESSADPRSRKFLEAFIQKMKNSLSTKFLFQKMEKDGPFVALTDVEFAELSRLRVIDTERFDCAFPSPL